MGVVGKCGDSGAIPCPEIQRQRVTTVWRSSGDIIHCPSWKCSCLWLWGILQCPGPTDDQCCRKGQLHSDLEDRNCGCIPALFAGAVLPAPAVFGNSWSGFSCRPAEQSQAQTEGFHEYITTMPPGKRGRGFLSERKHGLTYCPL